MRSLPSWRVASLTSAPVGVAILCTLLAASRANALELGEDGSLASLRVHGFVSQGFILTTKNDYLADDTTRGSFEYSELGLNFTKELTESLRMGVQLFAQDMGPRGDYKVIADWFYVDYRWQDWLGLRAGRLKIPYGLHNEIQDVDAARVPVLLPQSVYPLQGRHFLFAQTGLELYGFARSPVLGALDYRLFAGTIFMDQASLIPPGSTVDFQFRVPYLVGGRLLWETPLEGLRVGGSAQYFRLETTATVPSIAPIKIKNRSLFWVSSAEYSAADLTLTAEYSRWATEQRSDNTMLSPPIDNVSERAYAMASYRLTPWFQPGAYYALYFRDVDNREGKQNYQHDVAATLRFDITPNWLVKLEGHYMVGAAGLLDPLRVSSGDPTAARRWGAFFAKTTAYF